MNPLSKPNELNSEKGPSANKNMNDAKSLRECIENMTALNLKDIIKVGTVVTEKECQALLDALSPTTFLKVLNLSEIQFSVNGCECSDYAQGAKQAFVKALTDQEIGVTDRALPKIVQAYLEKGSIPDKSTDKNKIAKWCIEHGATKILRELVGHMRLFNPGEIEKEGLIVDETGLKTLLDALSPPPESLKLLNLSGMQDSVGSKETELIQEALTHILRKHGVGVVLDNKLPKIVQAYIKSGTVPSASVDKNSIAKWCIENGATNALRSLIKKGEMALLSPGDTEDGNAVVNENGITTLCEALSHPPTILKILNLSGVQFCINDKKYQDYHVATQEKMLKSLKKHGVLVVNCKMSPGVEAYFKSGSIPDSRADRNAIAKLCIEHGATNKLRNLIESGKMTLLNPRNAESGGAVVDENGLKTLLDALSPPHPSPLFLKLLDLSDIQFCKDGKPCPEFALEAQENIMKILKQQEVLILKNFPDIWNNKWSRLVENISTWFSSKINNYDATQKLLALLEKDVYIASLVAKMSDFNNAGNTICNSDAPIVFDSECLINDVNENKRPIGGWQILAKHGLISSEQIDAGDVDNSGTRCKLMMVPDTEAFTYEELYKNFNPGYEKKLLGTHLTCCLMVAKRGETEYFKFTSAEVAERRANGMLEEYGPKLRLNVRAKDVEKALCVVMPILIKHKHVIGEFKFSNMKLAEKAFTEAKDQKIKDNIGRTSIFGGQGTLYLNDWILNDPASRSETASLVKEMTEALMKNGIEPGRKPDSDDALGISKFFSFRNDSAGKDYLFPSNPEYLTFREEWRQSEIFKVLNGEEVKK